MSEVGFLTNAAADIPVASRSNFFSPLVKGCFLAYFSAATRNAFL